MSKINVLGPLDNWYIYSVKIVAVKLCFRARSIKATQRMNEVVQHSLSCAKERTKLFHSCVMFTTLFPCIVNYCVINVLL